MARLLVDKIFNVNFREALQKLSEPPMNGHFYMVWYR